MEYLTIKYKKDRQTYIKQKISESPAWAIKALVTIYEQQTYAEQTYGYTHVQNGIGFSFIDSEYLSQMAKQIKEGKPLSKRQISVVQKMMPKYAGQLRKIADRKQGIQ